MTDDRSATSPHSLLGRKVGPYRIERLLGEGGMGHVFAATVRSGVHGLSRGDRVAVKTIHDRILDNEDAVTRFERRPRRPSPVDGTGLCGTIVPAMSSSPETAV